MELTNSIPGELTPLFDQLDPEALDALFAPIQGGPARNQGHVKFPYAGFSVIVHANGRIALDPNDC